MNKWINLSIDNTDAELDFAPCNSRSHGHHQDPSQYDNVNVVNDDDCCSDDNDDDDDDDHDDVDDNNDDCCDDGDAINESSTNEWMNEKEGMVKKRWTKMRKY